MSYKLVGNIRKSRKRPCNPDSTNN